MDTYKITVNVTPVVALQVAYALRAGAATQAASHERWIAPRASSEALAEALRQVATVFENTAVAVDMRKKTAQLAHEHSTARDALNEFEAAAHNLTLVPIFGVDGEEGFDPMDI